ncbi:hypothetical protein JSE7799_02668 [Jannaschia seosinensis]|uniref:Uncharacterized protein n=1 Tax=Jannaschia seosinensis TaxID=313367 RepID=A0A0M7BB29_9RHOB|nr:hypothetical protein [Jannaschia seosinensis]CUH39940.1 hypothetical protein JSE7799_02668 [Jannaschia seosinensis]
MREAIQHNEQLRKEQRKGHRLDEVQKLLPAYRQHVSPRKWREAQECELVEREADVQGREEKLVRSETAVVERERVASDRQREADGIPTVAQAVADGDLLYAEDAQTPEAAQDHDPAPDKPTLARRLFGMAVARLRKDEQAAARSELAGAFEEVRQADDAIVRIANLLPMELRKQVALARKSLTHSIMTLTSQVRGDRDRARGEPPRE